jgi:hypothetical protein
MKRNRKKWYFKKILIKGTVDGNFTPTLLAPDSCASLFFSEYAFKFAAYSDYDGHSVSCCLRGII